ncbi:MAG: hypothetical protein NW203_06430 [Hyphomonadaceae bacterium]|nr:hypothetical protein [Hyphomonadaceae bacterium]
MRRLIARAADAALCLGLLVALVCAGLFLASGATALLAAVIVFALSGAICGAIGMIARTLANLDAVCAALHAAPPQAPCTPSMRGYVRDRSAEIVSLQMKRLERRNAHALKIMRQGGAV